MLRQLSHNKPKQPKTHQPQWVVVQTVGTMIDLREGGVSKCMPIAFVRSKCAYKDTRLATTTTIGFDRIAARIVWVLPVNYYDCYTSLCAPSWSLTNVSTVQESIHQYIALIALRASDIQLSTRWRKSNRFIARTSGDSFSHSGRIFSLRNFKESYACLRKSATQKT